MAQELQTQYNLDPEGTFTSGVSNGGRMSYHLVYERLDVFKAAGSILGRMDNNIWKNRNEVAAVSILQISGKIDPWENYYTDNVITRLWRRP